MVAVLFVCTGNICRSPTAEGVFRRLVDEAGLAGAVHIDSAGTTDYHVGEAPDPRAREAARRRGIRLDGLCARQVAPDDFDRFDLVLAMDRGHLRQLERLCPPGREGRLRLFMDFAPHMGADEVPDPYYGTDKGFDYVLDLVEAGAQGLLEHLKREHL